MAEKKPSYWELLRDPRWQQKRLRVMERAKFTCEECGETTKTLNVHHCTYERGRDPWDYEDDWLKCWCEPCHKEWTTQEKLLRDVVGLHIGNQKGLLIVMTAAMAVAIEQYKSFGTFRPDDWRRPIVNGVRQYLLNQMNRPEYFI